MEKISLRKGTTLGQFVWASYSPFDKHARISALNLRNKSELLQYEQVAFRKESGFGFSLSTNGY